MFRIILYFITLTFISGCSKSEIKIINGITQELAIFRKNTISDIEYNLNFIIPDSISKIIKGNADINFTLSSNKTSIQLDFKGDTSLKYETVINGNKLKLEIENEHLLLHKSHLRKGKNSVQIVFDCPDISLNRNTDFLYTLFVPDRASTAFPCFDQPDLKARFNLKLEIPSHWKAVSNSAELTNKVEGNKKQIEFETTKPIPSYLFSFTAGIFDTISRSALGKTYTLYHREKELSTINNNIDSIFSLLFLSINKIEKYTGIPYPFEKYDLIAIPSFQYNGMEHPGAIYYRSSSLFLDQNPTRQQLLKRANLIAHETAHIWFGDLVTMPWFDEVWLKEVFANFIADKVVSPIFPELNFDVLFHLSHFDAAYSVDRTNGANAIGQNLKNMNEAGSLYGSIIYHKSPIIMSMLEKRTGENALRIALQKYLRTYAYGNAGWTDLLDLIDVKDKKELQKWSDIWVYSPGRPNIKANKLGDNLIIEQTDPMNLGRVWPLNFSIAFSDNKVIKYKDVNLSSGKTVMTDFFAKSKVDWIYLNPKGNLYAFVNIDSLSQESLIGNFSDYNNDLFRASLLTDLYENLCEKNIETGTFIDFLLKSLSKEKNRLIYERMLNYLENSYLYKTSISEKLKNAEFVEKTLWTEFHNNENKRTAIINCIIKTSTTTSSIRKLEKMFYNTDIEADYYLSNDQQSELAFNLALNLPEKALDILAFHEKRISNNDKLERFRFIKNSVDPDLVVRSKHFAQLLNAKYRERETWVDVSMAFLNHPIRQNESLKFIRPALDELIEIQKTGDIFFPKSWLENLLKGHNSREAAEIVKTFLAENPDYPENLKMKILQSANHLLK